MIRVLIALLGFALAAFTPAGEDVAGLTLVRSKAAGARADAVETQRDVVKSGATAIRFTIRAGDCVPEDCAEDRERVELKSVETEREGGRSVYRWSFFLPEDFQSVWPARAFIAQFHQEGAHPAFLFSLEPEGLVFENQFLDRAAKAVLIPAEELVGRWHDIEIAVTWSRQDGGVRVRVDGDERVSDRGQTMSAGEAYFKIGLYRAHISRFGAPLPEQVMIVDDVSRKAE